jgi:hypothetical protein
MAKLKRTSIPVPGPGTGASSEAQPPSARGVGGPRDPRWALLGAQLTPATIFLLMTGAPADVRMQGWVAAASGDSDPVTVWRAHRDVLIAEAAAHGFEPHALTHRVPTGDGFERWVTAFYREHSY